MQTLNDLQDVYLRPGEIFFGKGKQIVVRTLLGSCVAITLWHPKKHFGGMCHVTMPTRQFTGSFQHLDTNYADEAMTYFMHKLTVFKLKPREFVVGLYGGGKMFDVKERDGGVGGGNVKAVREQLMNNSFHIFQESTAGENYRKIWLSLEDGNVKLVETRNRAKAT